MASTSSPDDTWREMYPSTPMGMAARTWAESRSHPVAIGRPWFCQSRVSAEVPLGSVVGS